MRVSDFRPLLLCVFITQQAASCLAFTCPGLVLAGTKVSGGTTHAIRNTRSPRAASQRAASWLCSAAALEPEKQVVKFTDPSTGVDVWIVGSMHYNPVSIRKATNTVDSLVAADQLHAVIVESCPTRWNKSRSSFEEYPWLKTLLSNEMHAAADRAEMAGVPVILGDQRIEDLTANSQELFRSSIRDVLSPFDNGWNRAAKDLGRAYNACFSAGDTSKGKAIGLGDFFDPALWAALPITFVRYPLSWLIRSPVGAALFVVVTAILTILPDTISSAIFIAGNLQDLQDGSLDLTSPNAESSAAIALIVGTFVSLLETVVLARLMLVALLDERNTILADSIKETCSQAEQQGGKAVVAILGMAHVNGVRSQILYPEESEDTL